MPKVARVPQWDPVRDEAAKLRPAAGRADRYFAFLSYSHRDEATAKWLHAALEQFQVPSALAGRETANGIVPKRLRPIFRDRGELPAADDLGAEIRQALGASRFLIVICSPAAAQSRWANAEIEAFKKVRPEGCILAAIVDGEPFASDTPGREAEECLPPALRHKYDRRGRPTSRRAEPLAADLRDDRDGKRVGFLKIVAGMLGIGLDELVQRETLRRQKRLAVIAAASLAGMAVTSTLAVVAVDARDAARDQRREAEGLVGFMLGDLRTRLEPLGRLDVLDSVGARALGYYEKQDKGGLSDESLAQRSKALTLMGEIANTRGDLDRAIRLYREALAGTEEALRRYPDDPQRLFDHAQNVFWVGYIDYQRGRPEQAAARFDSYKRIADQMVALAPDKKEYRLEQVYASTNLATVLLDVRRYREAATTYQASLGAAETLAAAEPKNVDYQKQVITGLAWLADAHEFSGELDQALAERERQLRLLDALERIVPRDSEVQRDAMTAHRAVGRLLASRGDANGGLKELLAGLALSEMLFRIEPENTEWLQASIGVSFDLADLLLATNQPARAGSVIRSGCDMTNRLAARDQSVSDWKSKLRATCLSLRARLALAEGNATQAFDLAKQSLAVANNSPKPLDRTMLRFRALAIGGGALAAAGERDQARRWWSNALAELPKSMAYRPVEVAELANVHARVGNQAESKRLMSALASMGYRYPSSSSSI